MMLRSVSETDRRKTGRQIPSEEEESFEISPKKVDCSMNNVQCSCRDLVGFISDGINYLQLCASSSPDNCWVGEVS